jgi:hypothetical protein
VTRILFRNKKIIDIDEVFKETNENFAMLLENLGLTATFDFSKRNNQKLYTHEFIKTFTEFLKYTQQDFVFFSNTLTKDKFRNQLLKKVRRIFKINIIEKNFDFEKLEYLLKIWNAEMISELEMAFQNRKTPSFRKISKYLEKEGLTFLNEQYFQEVINKMTILIK